MKSLFKLIIAITVSVIVSPLYAKEPCVREVSVGLVSEWPPLIIFENERNLGFEVDVARAIFAKTGMCLKFNRLPSSARSVSQLEKGASDIVLMASFTEERARMGHFTKPYRQERMRLFGIKQPSSFKSIVELLEQGVSIAISTGSYYGAELEPLRHLAKYDEQIVEVSSAVQRAQLLKMGRVDYIIEDELVGVHLLERYDIEGVLMLPYIVHDNDVHYLLNKDTFTKQDIENINNAISEQKPLINHLLTAYLGQPLFN